MNSPLNELAPNIFWLLAFDVPHYVLGHHDAPLTRAEFEALAEAMKKAGKAVARHAGDPDSQFTPLFEAGVAHESS